MFSLDLPFSVTSLLAECEKRDIVEKLTGLSLMPEYQANQLRILTLLQASLVWPTGNHRVSHTTLAAMLNGLNEEEAGENEDPAEDVFVSAVSMDDGEYRIFNGIYPASDLNLQRMLDAVLSNDTEEQQILSRQCRALLLLSETVARRCGLVRNQYASSAPRQDAWPLELHSVGELGSAARFSTNDLSELGIDVVDLDPFVLENVEHLLSRPFGQTELCRRPLLMDDGTLHLPIAGFVSPALRLHLAHAIARGAVPRSCAHAFHELQLARWIACDLPGRGTKILDNEMHNVGPPDFEMPGDYAHIVAQFDENKLAFIAIMGNDWSDPPDHDIGRVRDPRPSLQLEFGSYLRDCRSRIRSQQGIGGGLTLVISDTPGWHINLDVGLDADEHWFTAGVTAHAFSMLLADPRFNLLELWKMLREQRQLRSAGIRFMVWPDLLNHWSIWRSMGHTFWPEAIDLRQFGAFISDTSLIQHQVAMTRLVRDVHSTPSIDGIFERVERWLDEGGPASESSKPLYFQPLAMVMGELICVVEGRCGPWWVASARPPFDPQDRQYLFLLWQTAAEWLLRLSEAAPIQLIKCGPIKIRILPVPDSIKDASEEVEFVQSVHSSTVTLVIPPNFMDQLATADNSGEAELVRWLAKAVLLASGVDLSADELGQWTAGVTSDPHLKMMHINMSRDVGLSIDLIANEAPYRVTQSNDMASASRHMRDELLRSGALTATATVNEIEGAEPVNSLLKAALDVHWGRCQALLREIDRAALLKLISRLIEAIHRRRVDSERAALSRSRFYAENAKNDDWAAWQAGSRDVAFRSYRILAEMAVCECPPSGGRKPGISDIDILAAEITHLIRTADSSDAVRFKLTRAGLRFLPDGTLETFEGGAKVFMQIYTLACFEESIAQDIDAYPTLFEPIDSIEPVSASAHGDSFLLAFEAEQGISLQDTVAVSVAMQELALEDETDVVEIRRSELKRRLNGRVDSHTIDSFISAFGLPARLRWDELPARPFDLNDVWPWLFERRLSLMMRPLLVTSTDDDPTLIYGVRQLDMGTRYATILLESGIWPKQRLTSSAAKKYVDHEIKRRGDAFEDEISSMFKDAHWRTFSRVPMTQLGAPTALGELDALAISPDGTIWIVAECKWFGAARTPREVAGWMQDYHGKAGDKLDRHLRRYAWIDENQIEIAKRLRIARPTKLVGRIVTTTPVPLSFTEVLPRHAEVWTKRELSQLIASSTIESSLAQ